MNNIQHAGDCSIYQVLFDKDGNSYECDICDCGALRRILGTHLDEDKIFGKIWVKHQLAIQRSFNIKSKVLMEG